MSIEHVLDRRVLTNNGNDRHEMLTNEAKHFVQTIDSIVERIGVYGEACINESFCIERVDNNENLRLWFATDTIQDGCSVTVERITGEKHTHRVSFVKEDLSKGDYFDVTDYLFSDDGEYIKERAIYSSEGSLKDKQKVMPGDMELVGAALFRAEQELRKYIGN